MTPRRLPEHIIRRIAVAGEVDPRTVRKLLRGEPVRGAAGERGRDALHDAGIDLAQESGEEREP
jgi:hypothetical protein